MASFFTRLRKWYHHVVGTPFRFAGGEFKSQTEKSLYDIRVSRNQFYRALKDIKISEHRINRIKFQEARGNFDGAVRNVLTPNEQFDARERINIRKAKAWAYHRYRAARAKKRR